MATLTPFGYDEDPQTYDEFAIMVAVTTDAKNGASFALGDLYNIGHDRFEDRMAQAFDEANVTIDTVKNYARVCQRFPRQRRKWNVSFQHYDVVRTMSDSDQEKLLSNAELNRWSRDTLRKERHVLEGVQKTEAIKGTVRVGDLITFFTQDKGLSEDTLIDITAKLAELETQVAESEAA